MKFHPLPQFCLAFGCLLPALQSPAQAVSAERIPLKVADGHLVVAVYVNESGPYNFLLDTGTSLTLVESSLYQQLKFTSGQDTTLNTFTRLSSRSHAIARSVAIGGQAIDGVEVLCVGKEELEHIAPHVQGALGENFLKHFDFLIDNQHHTLTLDRTRSLAGTLSGDRIGVVLSSRRDNAMTPDRLIVTLKISSFANRRLRFLVDSGVNIPIFFPLQVESWRAMQGYQTGAAHTLDGNSKCRLHEEDVNLGRQTIRNVVVATCEELTRDRADVDGLLPTGFFQRIFISHRDSYIIANPEIRTRIPEMPAAAGRIVPSDAVLGMAAADPVTAMPKTK